jgi:hypothetical protein
VILEILAQESVDSKLRLKRYEENKFRGLKYEFWEDLGVYLEI